MLTLESMIYKPEYQFNNFQGILEQFSGAYFFQKPQRSLPRNGVKG
jgi:hypothetical protein